MLNNNNIVWETTVPNVEVSGSVSFEPNTYTSTGTNSAVMNEHQIKTVIRQDIKQQMQKAATTFIWKNGPSSSIQITNYDVTVDGTISYTADGWPSITDGCTTTTTGTGIEWTRFPVTPNERLKAIIQKRQAPMFLPSRGGDFYDLGRNPLQKTNDEREARARQTLHRVIGSEKYRKFIKHGFVSVTAKSGLTYQIFPSHGITCVYKRGEMVERLCVVLKGQFPPTDSLIMRYLMILNNEEEFRDISISHKVFKPKPRLQEVDHRPLAVIYQELKNDKNDKAAA